MSFYLPLRRLTAVLAAAVALPACQQICPLNMAPPPVFMLAFSADTATTNGVGFRRAEVRSAYLVRYTTADFQQPTDTLRQPTPQTPLNNTKPVLAIYYGAGHPPQLPLPDNGNQQPGRSYRLVLPAANRTYDINNIVLKEELGKTRCEGYRITRREATVNGQLFDGLNNPPEIKK